MFKTRYLDRRRLECLTPVKFLTPSSPTYPIVHFNKNSCEVLGSSLLM